MTRHFDDALAPAGLKSTQFVVLVAIHAARAPSLRSLARSLDVERTALLRQLDKLTERGLTKMSSSRPGGASNVVLTRKGKLAVERAVPCWAEAQTRLIGALGEDIWRSVAGVLPDVPDAVRRA